MNWFEAAFLGLIQGLTEFLPISSSAHLRIVGEILPNAQDPGAAFTAITQLGTETAVVVFFWRDIVRVVFGLILAIADHYGRQTRSLDTLTPKHGILFGFAQALALIPGVSRSGGTITAGLLMGYPREAAARYSFLLAIPAVFASGLYKLVKSFDEPGVYTLAQTGLATAVAFVVGFLIVGWFLKFVSSHSYRVFVWYRILLGLGLYVVLGMGLINP